MSTRVGPGPVPLFLAFALGYFFSALLRAVIATLAPQFSAEMGLSAADLGLLAGVFFGDSPAPSCRWALPWIDWGPRGCCCAS